MSAQYGAIPTRDEEEGPEERKRKVQELSQNEKWTGMRSSSVRVSTYSAYSRKSGLVSHGLAKTGQTEMTVGKEELTQVLRRWAGIRSERRLKEETKETWRERLFRRVAPFAGDDAAALRKHVDSATNWSVVVNVVLTLVKLWSAYVSGSLAVLASLVDSFLDLAQTGVLYVVEKRADLPPDQEFPAGQKRLEPVGVIVCAMLMAIGSAGVIFESCETLADFFFAANEDHHQSRPSAVVVSPATMAVLVVTVLSKAVLWVYCAAVAKDSSTALALAEDHANDVASNSVAILAVGLAAWHAGLWWCDPVGAILISLYIIKAWYYIAKEEVEQIVGKGATDEQVQQITALANSYAPGTCFLDHIVAYHFGPAFLVEIEMAVDDDHMHVSQIHHHCHNLAKVIEGLDWVERCFVSFNTNDPHEHLNEAKEVP